MRRFFRVVGVASVKGWALAGLVSLVTGSAAAEDSPRIVAVHATLQYLAQRLVEDAAEVTFPVPEGVDPSFWRPSVDDIARLQSADLILLNGAGFATWVDRVSLPRARLVNTSAAFRDSFIATQSVTHSHGDGGAHSHAAVASYTWLDPTLAIAQAEAIAARIAGRGIAPAQDVYDRLTILTAALTALDAETQAVLSNASDGVILATHPRYQYFADRYGLEIDALDWEAGAMPTEEQLSDLQARAAATGARVLIWEAAPSQAALDAVAALGLQNVVFDPMARNVPGGSFVAAYQSAVTALSDALDATARN